RSVASRAGRAGPPIPNAVRHRSCPARFSRMGSLVFLALTGDVRNRALVGIAPPSGVGAGPVGDQTALLASPGPGRILRLGVEDAVRACRDPTQTGSDRPALLSGVELRPLPLHAG